MGLNDRKWIRFQVIWNRTLPKICRFADLADLKLNGTYLIFHFFHWIFPFGTLGYVGESSNCTRFTMRVKNVFAITLGYIITHKVTVWAIIRLGWKEWFEICVLTRTWWISLLGLGLGYLCSLNSELSALSPCYNVTWFNIGENQHNPSF